MSDEEAEKCCICKKTITRNDLREHKSVYCEFFPGDHVCCTEHPGVKEEYTRLLSLHEY